MFTSNYIAGQWVAGEDSIPNINPSDTRETIGDFAQASSSQVEEAIDHGETLAVGKTIEDPAFRPLIDHEGDYEGGEEEL